MRDKVTRGTTHPGRLRALDDALLRRRPRDHGARELLVLDLGIGDTPETTLELSRALEAQGWRAQVIGVEIDEERVAAAQAYATPAVSFVRGGLELADLERAPDVIRAMNVLRQYSPSEAEQALETLSGRLAPGGVLLEGTCDRLGQRLGAHWIERGPERITRRAMLWHNDFSRGFSPWMMRDWLPQDVRRSVSPGTQWWAFFERWHQAWEASRGGAAAAEAFTLSVLELRERGERVEVDPWWLERGYLWWEPSGGVPEANRVEET